MSLLTFSILVAGLLLMAFLAAFYAARAMSPEGLLLSTPAGVTRPILTLFGALFLIVFISFRQQPLAVMALGMLLPMTIANLERLWLARALGEQAYSQLIDDATRRVPFRYAALSFGAAGFFQVVLGGLVVLLGHEGWRAWTGWLGIGIALNGVATVVIRLVALRRRYVRARA